MKNHRQNCSERDELRARFTSWLETVVKRAKIDYLRKLNRKSNFVSIDEVPESMLVVDSTENEWLRGFRQPNPYDFEEERLAKAFMELPIKRRQVMELLFLEDLSEAETAKQLNCSIQYVRNQRCIALKKLRSRLLEGGGDN